MRFRMTMYVFIMEQKKRQKCEVYSRVVGYYRPVEQWNEGKQAEFTERKEYDAERVYARHPLKKETV